MGRVPYIYCPKCEALMNRSYTRPTSKSSILPYGHVCIPCQHVIFDEVSE